MKFRFCLLVGLTLLLMTLMAGGPAAAWKYTSSDPLVFDFKNAPSGNYTVPFINNELGQTIYSISSSVTGDPTDGTKMEHQNSRTAPADWRHNISGSGLAIRSNAESNSDINWSYSKVLTWDDDEDAEPSHLNINWVRNGLVFETRATSRGDMRSSDYEDGYTWGGNWGRGGMGFSFNVSGYWSGIDYAPGLMLSWQTNDPTDPNDDCLILYDPNNPTVTLLSVNYPLGGTPTSPPVHTYRVETRHNRLTVHESNGLQPARQLVNVYVDGERVIKNRSILARRQGSTKQWFFVLGNGGHLDRLKNLTGLRGDEFEYFKIYENDYDWDDETLPNPPQNVSKSVSATYVHLTWSEPEEISGKEIIGYHIERDGVYKGYTEWITTSFIDGGLTPSRTYTYRVGAVDTYGNVGWSEEIEATTLAGLYAGDVLTFDFDNVFGDPLPEGSTVFSDTTDPSLYYTEPVETTDFWIGKKGLSTGDGGLSFDSALDHYWHTFSSADGGSLTIQSVSPGVDPLPDPVGRSWAATNDLSSFYKWIMRPGYPEPGKTYYRGNSMEAEISIVGDKNGWCAAWGEYPAIGECPWQYDLCHQASDWGANSPDAHKTTLFMLIKSDLDLAAPGHEGFANTENGTGLWISAIANLIDDPLDDVVLFSSNAGPRLALGFRDGLGLGLTPDRNRNGIIEGTGNRIKLKVAAANAGGADEYWDVWVTRPNGDTIHLNPLTCYTATGYGASANSGFGGDGHTFKDNYRDNDSRNPWCNVQLGLRDTQDDNYHGEYFGIQYHKLTIRNDWDADVSIAINDLTDLRKLGIGSKITWDGSGPELIVTIDPVTFDMSTYFFYIEQEDRSIGIKVADHSNIPPMVWKGEKIVNMQAFLRRDADGNPYLDVTNLECETETTDVEIQPIGMTNLVVGGQDVTGGTGLSNVGLLATVWGEVTDAQYYDSGLYFTLNDGSDTQVKVLDSHYDGILVDPPPAIGEYWSATGAVALESDGAEGFIRTIILDSAQKLK